MQLYRRYKKLAIQSIMFHCHHLLGCAWSRETLFSGETRRIWHKAITPYRTYNDSELAQRAISHMCIRKDSSSVETKHLPREPCSLTRSQVFFPSCWDGENLDSDDHQSHVSLQPNFNRLVLTLLDGLSCNRRL